MVAKFLGNNLPQLETQAVSYFLRQVRMRATAEYFDIRHFVAVQGVVQSERAAVESEGAKRPRQQLGTAQQLMGYSYRAKVCSLPIHHYVPHITRAALPPRAARTLSLTFRRDDVTPDSREPEPGAAGARERASEAHPWIFFTTVCSHMQMNERKVR